MKLLYMFFFSFVLTTLAQKSSLTGKITNQKTSEAIPFVNIGVEGTYFGTSSNENGNFKLVLKNGSHKLIVSCVGYQTKTISITLPSNKMISVQLNPIAVELPEVIVDADENPAYKIIRKAIANKIKNKEGLFNYHYNFYSKNIFKSGKEIVFIEEDVGEGFKKLPNEVKELKSQLSKTENISENSFSNTDLNFFEKKIIDFTDDSLTLGKFTFHLPISKFAFSYYDYELLGLKQSDDQVYYLIKVIPYSKIRPTFAGEILIEDSSFALTAINLTLENRNLLPFTDFKMSIIQKLFKYEGYWFPKYYNIDVETNMNYYHLIKLDSAITSFVKVFNNIKKNIDLESPTLSVLNHVGDSTFKYEPKLISKLDMDSLRLYPLELEETIAYEKIDSNKSIVSSLKLGGIGGEYIKSNITENEQRDSSFGVGKLFKYLDLQNNRVDGLMLGMKYLNRFNKNSINFSTHAGYSFARKDIESVIYFNIPIKNYFLDDIELKANYGTLPTNSLTTYSEYFNAISVTFGFEDQFNYYFSRGISLGTSKNISSKTNIKLKFNFESQKSVSAIKYYSIFNSRRELRENLQIFDGMDNRVLFKFNLGNSPYNFNVITSDGLTSEIEVSSKLLSSDFDYFKINFAGQFFITTLFDELFFSPYLAVFFEVKSVFGDYGPQHLVTPQAAMGVYSPLGTFKGLRPYQFLGDKLISLHLEHNWRKTFFDMIGIYFPVGWNLELNLGVNGLNIWNNSKYLSEEYSNQFYWEVYGGFSGILGLININVAYNKFKETTIRFGFSRLF